MVVADLHVHTTVSDGTLDPAEVPAVAAEVGLDAVAITDHDRLNPALVAPVATVDGVAVVNGIELRVEAGDQRLDLLGYGVSPTDDLRAAVDRLQADRVSRARAIVECVEARLGVSLDVSLDPGVGRPHVARAIAESPADVTAREAFQTLIGDDCPCFVARDVPSFERGRDLLAAACDLVALAHPLRYADTAAALALTESLDAVERWYPYDAPADPGPVEDALDAYDLVPTGGSDAHDRTLGVAGLDRSAYDRVRGRLAG
jgi:predicted metal-dependent phosphoesterase TrpH